MELCYYRVYPSERANSTLPYPEVGHQSEVTLSIKQEACLRDPVSVSCRRKVKHPTGRIVMDFGDVGDNPKAAIQGREVWCGT